MAEVQQIQCNDARCLYATNDDCDCKHCGGALHGSKVGNMGDPQWVAKTERLSKTRKAFRKLLNSQEKGSGTRLYRRNREEFDKQYAIWAEVETPAEQPEEIKTVHVSGNETTVVKDMKVGNDTYSHVRRSNGKTEYRKNDKVITKAEVPAELGW